MATAREKPPAPASKVACAATNRNGAPCGAPPLAGSDRCAMHTPARRREVQRARRSGGRARMRDVDRPPLDLGPLDSPAALVAALGVVARALAAKGLAARDANALTLTIAALSRLVAPAAFSGLPPGVRVGALPSGPFRLRVEVVRPGDPLPGLDAAEDSAAPPEGTL